MPVAKDDKLLPALPEPHKQVQKPDEVDPAAGGFARSVGSWIYHHKKFTDTNPFGYTAYQFTRSAFASIPYGVSMAATWLGFQKATEFGKGLEESKTAGAAIKQFGMRLRQFTEPGPVRLSAMVATSFTLYRATSKIGKWVNESLTDPDNTEAQTINKVHELPKAIWGKIGEVMPAEMSSTPISAIVLGFVLSNYKPAAIVGTRAGMKAALAEGKGLEYFNKVVWGPGTKFVEHSAIGAIGYSLFFELGDRRFKDKQLARGMWGGEPHSIGSHNKSSPSLREEPFNNVTEAEERVNKKRETDPHVNDTLHVLTSEPSVPRFLFRRVLPTAIGITGYTAFKFRGAPMFLGHLAKDDANVNTTLKGLSDIPLHSWREGAATSLFFMIPWVTDKYVKYYDNFVNNLEEMVSGRKSGKGDDKQLIKPQPVPPEDAKSIKQNQEALLAQLNEKEQGVGVVLAR